jgi:hypothetical protein
MQRAIDPLPLIMETADTIRNEKGWPACRASFEFLNPLASGYKLHFAPESELRKHSGVCAACHAKFTKKNLPVINGERAESPASLNGHHHALDLEQDHAAYESDGHAEQVSDFDFEDVFTALDGVSKSRKESTTAAAALREIWHWCFSSKSHSFAKTGAMRFAVLISGIDPATCGGATLETIASELGFTKAAACKASVLFQEKFGLKFARSRQDEGRSHMADARRGKPGHNRRKEAAP